MLSANSLAPNASSAALPSPNVPSSVGNLQNSGTPSQKDFAIALGVSQARISQLVKIGMPLNSIAAAKEWRMKRQRSNDADADAAETADSPDAASGVSHALCIEAVDSNIAQVTQPNQRPLLQLLGYLPLK